MQIDFHYYCIGVLARAAGFNGEDALTIAYASQYTDDATESEPMRLKLGKNELQFEPVCTAYSHLEDLGKSVLNWSLQKRVYIPFHFVPARPFEWNKSRQFSFVTQPNSPFANWLIKKASEESDYKRRLCAVGIALHSFADTWAHCGFSGRQNNENDIGKIEIQEDSGDYESIARFVQGILNILPEIGHAEAGYYPDLSYLKWRYVHQNQAKKYVERDNVIERLEASEVIYTQLCKIPKQEGVDVLSWESIAQKLEACFRYRPENEVLETSLPASKFSYETIRGYYAFETEKVCQKWRKTFNYLFKSPETFEYDEGMWREEVFGQQIAENWHTYSIADWFRSPPIKVKHEFWDSHWVHFHKAALKQRHLVLENIP